MSINNLAISYPDFQLNTVIEPEYFDINNSEIVTKVNEVIVEANKMDAIKVSNDSLVASMNDLELTYTVFGQRINEMANNRVSFLIDGGDFGDESPLGMTFDGGDL